jgi:uncharacterized protein YqgV (UPF0045/DUF77 family)
MIMKKGVIQIAVTTDYTLFNYLPMNRVIDSKQVEALVQSVREMGVTRQVICIKTNCIDGELKTFIIDGQHLVHACQREGIPVEYRYIEITDEDDIVRKMAFYNNSSKSWKLMDYVNAWKYIHPDYLTLKKYKELYNLEPLMIAGICNNADSYNGVYSASEHIKNGNFRVTNPKAQAMCKDFSDLFIKIGKADRWVKHNFLRVFIQAYNGKQYDHKTTLQNIDDNIKTIKAMTDVSEANQFIQKNVFNLI